MSFFVDKRELVERKDSPQWNLLTGTSQEFQTITISKGTYFPGYMFQKQCYFPVTFSAIIKNDSKYDIGFHLDHGGDDAESNFISANSEGQILVHNHVTTGGYFVIKGQINADSDITFEVKEAKLEKGNTATPWCPALEDYAMKSDFDALNARIPTQTITSDITENVMSWEAKSMDQHGSGDNHLRFFGPITQGTRFSSNFIKVYPNETVSVEVNPLANKNFVWQYYLTDSPQEGALLYNPDADWTKISSTTFNTGNAKYIIFLVGNNDKFTGVNTWKLKFTHNVNLVIEG